MPARHRRSRSYLPDAVLLAFIALGWLVGPRIVDARAALHWTRYYAAQGAAVPRPVDAARHAGRSAARVVDRVAPLPWAAEAARNALTFGRALETTEAERPAALVLYTEVRTALDRVRGSRIRGLGLGVLAAESRGLEDAARSAVEAAGAAP